MLAETKRMYYCVQRKTNINTSKLINTNIRIHNSNTEHP